MADKQISDLTAATSIQPSDLFVLEQSATAKKLTGQVLINWLTNYADGHGGINSIVTSSSGTSGDGATHTITITMADTTQMTFTVRDGVKGLKGDTWYFWVKYAADLPTSDADMSDVPDNYIGIYMGYSSTAPTAYTDYTWYQWKGDKGDTGEPCEVESQSVTYMESTSGTIVPTGSWTTTIPSVASGHFLWSRTQITFTDGTVTTIYSVSRNGIDGAGSVSSVNSVSPDANGNVSLDASYIPTGDNLSVQSHISDLDSKMASVLVNIATSETSPSTVAHSVGEFILYENDLYKVTAAIAAGDYLVSGTNITAATIGYELANAAGVQIVRW